MLLGDTIYYLLYKYNENKVTHETNFTIRSENKFIQTLIYFEVFLTFRFGRHNLLSRGLLLALCSRITSGELRELYGVLGNES